MFVELVSIPSCGWRDERSEGDYFNVPHACHIQHTAHRTYRPLHVPHRTHSRHSKDTDHCNYLFEKEGPESALFGHVEANETGSKIDEDGDTLYRREGREIWGGMRGERWVERRMRDMGRGMGRERVRESIFSTLSLS